MSVCKFCQHEMRTADGCVEVAVKSKGKEHKPIPWGGEQRFGDSARGTRCPDCGAQPGRHHHPGCDVEECPICRRQLITCGCTFAPDYRPLPAD